MKRTLRNQKQNLISVITVRIYRISNGCFLAKFQKISFVIHPTMFSLMCVFSQPTTPPPSLSLVLMIDAFGYLVSIDLCNIFNANIFNHKKNTQKTHHLLYGQSRIYHTGQQQHKFRTDFEEKHERGNECEHTHPTLTTSPVSLVSSRHCIDIGSIRPIAQLILLQ